MKISNMSVATRVYGAFGALVGLLGLVGAIGFTGVQKTSGIFDSYRAAARQTMEIQDYLADVASMRLSFLNFLLDPSPEREADVMLWARDVASTDAGGLALFQDSAEDLKAIDDVTKEANIYILDFENLVAARAAGDAARADLLSAEMQSVGPHMYQVYTTMAERAENIQNTLGPIATSSAHFQVILVLSISGFGILVGLVAAFITGRWLSKAIGGMTQSMHALANGQIDMEIAGTEPDHELGQMARALQVFQTNAHAVRAAEAEKNTRTEMTLARARMMEAFQQVFDSVIDATADGDFTKRIDTKFNDPDIDRISANFDSMLASISAALGEAGDVLGALAHADLTRRMEGTYHGAFAELQSDTNAVSDKLGQIVTQLRDTSNALKLATGEILAGANDLSDRTTKQAATIEETSAAMEQLAATVVSNSKRAIDASEKANTTAKAAEEGGAVMNSATGAMERITLSSSKISNIIGLIDDIAFQTNLLALNASVEAARAGDAGKGFAVVAVEVRRLAQSAASASSEVKVLIDQSAVEVHEGTNLVASAAAKLGVVLESIRSSTELMDGIARDSQEQASGIQEVTIAVRQMDEMTQHNAALVEEMNAAIEQTEGQATKVDEIVDIFKVGAAVSSATREFIAAVEKPRGSERLQPRIKASVRGYHTAGNAAKATEWNEF